MFSSIEEIRKITLDTKKKAQETKLRFTLDAINTRIFEEAQKGKDALEIPFSLTHDDAGFLDSNLNKSGYSVATTWEPQTSTNRIYKFLISWK